MKGSLSFPNSCITSNSQQRGEEAPCSSPRLCQAAPWDCAATKQGPAQPVLGFPRANSPTELGKETGPGLQAKTTSCMARACELFKLQTWLWGAEQPAVL